MKAIIGVLAFWVILWGLSACGGGTIPSPQLDSPTTTWWMVPVYPPLTP